MGIVFNWCPQTFRSAEKTSEAVYKVFSESFVAQGVEASWDITGDVSVILMFDGLNKTYKGKNTAQAKETTRGKVYTNNLIGLEPRGLSEGVEEDKALRVKS